LVNNFVQIKIYLYHIQYQLLNYYYYYYLYLYLNIQDILIDIIFDKLLDLIAYEMNNYINLTILIYLIILIMN